MRLAPLHTTAGALVLLFALTACGSDDPSSLPAAFGGGAMPEKKQESGFKGLAKAGSMAGAARLVGGYTRCTNVNPGGDDSESEEDAKYGKTYSVTERGTCNDEDETGIFMIKDPKTFQAAIKADIDKEYAEHPHSNVNMGPVIGQDFASGSQSSQVMAAMLGPGSGMRVLNCHPDFNPPSGYSKEPALVKGCVLTDYLSEE
ncbi:hypothetical protein OTB20_35640 [Streptomyces sp. H27-H1]|uniref:hypothetical protein n=1 Tax=Streptomyces sp. H27-H1 TaxID=2996461 RepID=UPI0022706F7D|nr:hypothetical protein [Streptomyces sp. H27-H1]MCY0931425.1 hypothetical protein [Streptomyces sp. H27-H1]